MSSHKWQQSVAPFGQASPFIRSLNTNSRWALMALIACCQLLNTVICSPAQPTINSKGSKQQKREVREQEERIEFEKQQEKTFLELSEKHAQVGRAACEMGSLDTDVNSQASPGVLALSAAGWLICSLFEYSFGFFAHVLTVCPLMPINRCDRSKSAALHLVLVPNILGS